MSSFCRLAGMARSHAALRKPVCNSFFSTTTSKRPLPLNFFKQPSSSLVPQVRQARAYSSGFGPQRRFQANMFLVKGFIGINVAVFGYSLYVMGQVKEGYTKNYIRFMQNMTLNVTDFKNGYYWEVLTSVVTHQNIWHIGTNLLTFWYLGRGLAAMPITPGQFMTVIVGSGVAGSLYWLWEENTKLQDARSIISRRGLGFSGAVLGATTVLACFQPSMKVGLFGVIPVPLGVLVVGYALYDGYYLNSQTSRTAHAGHLGGLGFGLAYYFLRLRGLRVPGSL